MEAAEHRAIAQLSCGCQLVSYNGSSYNITQAASNRADGVTSLDSSQSGHDLQLCCSSANRHCSSTGAQYADEKLCLRAGLQHCLRGGSAHEQQAAACTVAAGDLAQDRV